MQPCRVSDEMFYCGCSQSTNSGKQVGKSIFWGYLSSWSGTELKTERRSFKLLLFWNSAEACKEHLLHMNEQLSMLAWLIIAFVTVAGTGTLAYFYYKLLNYFIRMKIEAEPDLEPLERETKLKRTFRVQEGEDSDEERINIFSEINNSDMTIERTWKNRQLLLSWLVS